MSTFSEFQSHMLSHLDKVLNEVDISKTSERMIRAKMTAELGEEVQEPANLSLIKERIEGFVNRQRTKRDAEEAEPASANPLLPKKKSRTEGETSGGLSSSIRGNSGGGGGLTWIELGGEKRASYTNFKGGNYVDLREFYSKGEEKLPGKKGIMLKIDEFKMISSSIPAITAAAKSCNLSFSLPLGNKRKVTISNYKNKTYVDVREYYDQGGEEKPGSKGLSMNTDQWLKFAEGISTIQSLI